MSLKTKSNKKTILSVVMIAIIPITVAAVIILAISNNTNTETEDIPSPIAPTQQVFKPTDKISFVLDLEKVPGLIHDTDNTTSNKIIEPAYAQTTYTEEDLTITPKVISTVTKEEVPIELEVQKQSDQTYLIAGENTQNNLVPGKYEVQVDITKDGNTQTFSQDFSWGVLAINTTKSIYTPGDEAQIHMAILDDKGNMVCDAEVELAITNPQGKTTLLSTSSGEISVTPGCSVKDRVLEPDYKTEYKIGETGSYNMQLKAVTENGEYEISDAFEVRDYVPFDIERNTATRIYPPVSYPVVINIKANEDFSGTIVEKVPMDFEILSNNQGLIEREKAEEPNEIGFVQKATFYSNGHDAVIKKHDRYQTVTWYTDLKKGEEYQLSYVYDAADISPEFYLIGPLTLTDQNNNTVFAEVRKWQIASDAISYVNGNSTASYSGSQGTSLTATSGNLLVFFCGVQSNQTITGPGVTWTQVYNQSGTPSLGAWYKISSGGLESPSCSWPTSDSSMAILLEYSGSETATSYILDTSNSATGNGDTTVECPSVTPSSGQHLYVSSFFASPGDSASINSWSNSFTGRQAPAYTSGPKSGRIIGGAADKISSGAQSTVATLSAGPATWRCQTLAFNENMDIVTGIVYTDDDEATPITSQSVCGVMDNTTPVCDTSDGSGVFVIEFDGTAGTAGSQLTFYLDGGTNFGNTVTVHDGNDILTADALRVYEDHVLVRYEQGASITIANMDAYDNDQNATDMLFDAEDTVTDTLSIEYGNELYIPSGFTFGPVGNVTSSHDIEIDGTWAGAPGDAVSLSGTYKLDSGGTLTPSTSTVTFDGTAGTEDIITTGTGGFYNLVINDGGTGSGVIIEVEDPLTVDNNLTITGGTLDVVSGENNQLNVGGNWDNDDIFLPQQGTVVMDGDTASTFTIDSDGSTADDYFYNLTFNDGAAGASFQLTTDLDVNNNITITGGTLDSNGNDIYVGGNWTNDDTFTEGTATVTFDGATNATIDSGCADESTCTNENFYNLTINKDEDATVSLSSTHLRVTNLIHVVTGWLIPGSLNIQAEGSTALDIEDYGRFYSVSTGNLTLGGNLINNGGLTINSNGMSCGDADSIIIASTAAAARSWSGAGGFRVSDVMLSYQTGSAVIYASSSTNNGDNGTNWNFVGCDETYFEGLSLEGLNIN